MTIHSKTRWTAQRRAMRDLIVQALDRVGPIEDEQRGQVSSLVRIECGLPLTPSLGKLTSEVLKLMYEDGLINRKTRNTRTFRVALVQPPVKVEKERLAAAEARNRELLRPKEAVDTASLCINTHTLLCNRVKDCTRHPRYADVYQINVTTLLRDHGLEEWEVKRVMQCLKLLHLIESVKSGRGDTRIWWWRIDTRAILSRAKMGALLKQHPHLATRQRAASDDALVATPPGEEEALPPVTQEEVARVAEATPVDDPSDAALLEGVAGHLRELRAKTEALTKQLAERDLLIEELKTRMRRHGLL